jgi:hypothetical protein
MTHEELASLLGVRVHNPLLQLTREGTLRRERMGPTFVYLHSKRTPRTAQRRRRRAAMPQRPAVRPTHPQTIATLLELIQDPKASREQIVRRCRRGGVAISPQVVDAIFERHELDKKRAP